MAGSLVKIIVLLLSDIRAGKSRAAVDNGKGCVDESMKKVLRVGTSIRKIVYR